jgi:hypothetical protein
MSAGCASFFKSLTAANSAQWKKKIQLLKPSLSSPPRSRLQMPKFLSQNLQSLSLPPRSLFLLSPLSSIVEGPQGSLARKGDPLRIRRALLALSCPPLSLPCLPALPPGVGTREPPALQLTSPAPSHYIAAPPFSPDTLFPVLAAISPLREESFAKRWRLLSLVCLMLVLPMPSMMAQEKKSRESLSTPPSTTWLASLLGSQLNILDALPLMPIRYHLDMSPSLLLKLDLKSALTYLLPTPKVPISIYYGIVESGTLGSSDLPILVCAVNTECHSQGVRLLVGTKSTSSSLVDAEVWG